MNGFWTDIGLQAAFMKETGLTHEDIEIKVRDCNRAFGGWGWESTELLGHYFSATTAFPVLPPAPDLLTKAQQAIFWIPFKNIAISPGGDLTDTIGDDGIPLYQKFHEIKQGLCKLFEWRSLWEATEIIGIHKARLERLLLEGLRAGHVNPDDALWGSLYSGIKMTIVCAVGYLIGKRDSEKFKHLLALWRSGNLPVGFNKENALVVLCKQ